MCTFFGEVLPVISRAVEDDDDEDQDCPPETNCYVRWSSNALKEIEASSRNCLQCSSVIIAIGPAASAFSKVYLLGQDPERVCVISSGLGDRDADNDSAHPDKTCHVYRLPRSPDVLICVCNADVTPEQSYSWVKQFLGAVPANTCTVAVLVSQPDVDYRTDNPSSDLRLPILRALTSLSYKEKPVCKFLEQPNTISGLPAQILTYCQVHQISAVLYVAYTESMYVDSDAILVFKQVLKGTSFSGIIQENTNAEKEVTKIAERHAQHDSLYM